MKLKRGYLSLLFCVMFSLLAAQCQKSVTQENVVAQEAIRTITDFYKAYTSNFLSEISSNDSLVRQYLTQGLIEKTGRMTAVTDSDPIIRAQDFREDIMETLKVKYLEGNWYMLSYDWVVDSEVNHTDIPLRVTKTDGHYMIDYITPAWNGSLHGDSLLYNHPERVEIDASTPLSLLKTFYTAYTMEYCSMSSGLNRRLAALRAEYLTSSALAQFEEAANEYKLLDGHDNYDLLIDNFDFDRLWIPSMKYVQLDKDAYRISYAGGETFSNIKLKVIWKGEEYRIDSITVEK
jgi:hypothetical protein